MYFPFVVFVVRPISDVSSWSFPDNRIFELLKWILIKTGRTCR